MSRHRIPASSCSRSRAASRSSAPSTREQPELTLSDVARRADITRAAARRFLLTLETLGYVRSRRPRRSPSPRGCSSSASATCRRSRCPRSPSRTSSALSREVDESVSAAVLDGADIVYVARVPTRRIMSVRITIGTRFPAYATQHGARAAGGAAG